MERLGELRDPPDNTSNYYDSYDPATFAALLTLEEVLLAFTSVLFLLHFVLFVRACVETHQYNKHSRPSTRIVYVPVPMQGMVPGQQPYGYYAYQPLPGQALPFTAPAQQQVQGGPVAPQQAHLNGYYAPAPAAGFAPQVPHDNRMSTVSGSSNPAAGHHAPPAGSVSAEASDRQ